jgi:selenocysteine lyase/cysteine desulfurase
MAGTTAAVDFLASIGDGDDRRSRLRSAYAAIERYEDVLRERLEEGLANLPCVVHSRARRRTPTVLVTFPDADAAEVSVALADRDINAPASSFYAWEASHHLGLGEAGGLRVGLAPYSTEDDVDRLLAALGELLTGSR